ncbi:hypothetical protein V5799_015043 [Amblyomma americanum]|uniref:Mannosyltransferase n=1 Tax=Amblyomma americanum TaxID=6943 RepID=A0AAQ4E1A1_AMBAM
MARQRRKEPRDHPRKLAAKARPAASSTCDDQHVGPWAPVPYTAFKALLSARLCAAVWNNIADCDETFNYWEPTHYLIAPMEVYMELGPLANLAADGHDNQEDIVVPSTLCVGKEWYRFPSSFFLPQNWELAFIESEFRGQLPKPYASGANATRIIPTDMNDANREEQSRYVNLSLCDYLVDTDGHDVTDREPEYSSSPEWEVVSSVKFLDSRRSPVYARAFYVPFVSERLCSYVNYYLLKRKKTTKNNA